MNETIINRYLERSGFEQLNQVNSKILKQVVENE